MIKATSIWGKYNKSCDAIYESDVDEKEGRGLD